jgi:hypothetical protein
MAYLGQQPVVGRYILLDQISGGFNGTASGFTMSTAGGAQGVIPGLAQNVLLSLGGVIQQPGVDYSISGSGLTFTTPPVSGTTFFATVLGDAQSVGTPSDGTVTPASIASGYDFAFPNLNVTGVVTIASGSAASPSLTFTGDLNTGLYSPGADQVAVATNGTGRLFVDANGNVGVGTSSISTFGGYTTLEINNGTSGAILDLSQGDVMRARFVAVTASATIETSGSIPFLLSPGGTEKLRVTSGGLVGIGTSSPNVTLDIESSSGTAVKIRLASNTSNRALSFSNAAETIGWTVGNGITAAARQFVVYDNEAGAARLLIDSSGRVGIGTTSPAYKCDIDVTGSALRLNSTTTQALLVISSDDAANAKIEFGDESDNDRGAITYDNPNNALIFQANAAERARIDSSGRLLVGTSTGGDVNYGGSTGGFHLVQGNADAHLMIRRAGSTGSLTLVRSNGTVDAPTVVANDDVIGQIRFVPYDGTDYGHQCARISAEIDGTPGANDVPARLVFSTAADGASSPTERLRIANNGTHTITASNNSTAVQIRDASNYAGQLITATDGTFQINARTTTVFSRTGSDTESMRIDSSGRLLVGTSTARSNFYNTTADAGFLLEGTGAKRRAAVIGADFAGALILALQKSGSAGGNTIVANGDGVGEISFQGNDGSEFVACAQIKAEIDNTPGSPLH